MSLLGYPKVIPYTKFKHFGIICFRVMLRTKTNKHTNRRPRTSYPHQPTESAWLTKLQTYNRLNLSRPRAVDYLLHAADTQANHKHHIKCLLMLNVIWNQTEIYIQNVQQTKVFKKTLHYSIIIDTELWPTYHNTTWWLRTVCLFVLLWHTLQLHHLIITIFVEGSIPQSKIALSQYWENVSITSSTYTVFRQ